MNIMAGLRRGAAQLNSGKGGRGPTRSGFHARWKPPHLNDDLLKNLTPEETRGTQIAEPVVFVPGEYADEYQKIDDNGVPLQSPIIQPAFRFRAHTFAVSMKPKNGGKAFTSYRDIVCSAGTEAHAPQPCCGCYYVDHGVKDSSPKDQWVFNIAHLSWYHTVPLVKDNQIQMKKDGSGPVLIKDECWSYMPKNQALLRADQMRRGAPAMGRQCDHCGQRHPFTWGDHRTLQVGKNHLENILALDTQLGQNCANCKTGIIVVAYDCEHCHQEMLDVASSGWTNAQLDQFSKSQYQCQRCQQVTRPVPAFECGYDLRTMQKVSAGCPDNVEPRPLTLFDVVVWIQREGESTKSAVVVKRWVPITEFTMPDGRLSGMEDGRPLVEALKEIAPKPFDLKAMYSPPKLEDQAKIIQRDNPYAQPQGPQYASYGAPGAGQQLQNGPQSGPYVNNPAQPPQGYGPPAGYGPPQQPQQQQPPQQPQYGPPGRPNYGR